MLAANQCEDAPIGLLQAGVDELPNLSLQPPENHPKYLCVAPQGAKKHLPALIVVARPEQKGISGEGSCIHVEGDGAQGGHLLRQMQAQGPAGRLRPPRYDPGSFNYICDMNSGNATASGDMDSGNAMQPMILW